MRKKPQAYVKAPMEEDQRITMIGETAMKGGRIGVTVDDEPGKPERYIEKLLTRYPQLQIVFQGPGPTPGIYTIVVTRMETPAS